MYGIGRLLSTRTKERTKENSNVCTKTAYSPDSAVIVTPINRGCGVGCPLGTVQCAFKARFVCLNAHHAVNFQNGRP